MKRLTVLLMTLYVASALSASPALADIFNQEILKTHLRWNLMVPRDQFFLNKKEGVLNIETVNLEMFHILAGELAKINADGQYIETITYSKENFPARPATITVERSTTWRCWSTVVSCTVCGVSASSQPVRSVADPSGSRCRITHRSPGRAEPRPSAGGPVTLPEPLVG